MTGFAPTLLNGKRYIVLGLGRNGLSAAHALADMGAEVTAWDDNEKARETLVNNAFGITLAPPDMTDHWDALVLSPGIPHILPSPNPIAAAAIAANIPILSDADILFEIVRASGSRARFAGITGTNGKSTTTALLAHMLRHAGIPIAEGGNLGPAALSLPLLPDNGIYVLEMSSYMLERLQTLHFDVACLLNMTPDHLDRHGDMSGYAAAKAHIFDRMTADDLAIIGASDEWSKDITLQVRMSGIPLVTISGEDKTTDLFCRDKTIFNRQNGQSIPQPISLPGAHNAENIAAVMAMASFLGISHDEQVAAVNSFPGLPHRQKMVACIDSITFIDDSKATNADATARALGCYEHVIWIAGGIAKAGGIESLKEFFPRITEAFLIGKDAQILADTLSSCGVVHKIVTDMAHAVPSAFASAQKHGVNVVLLSPACASFDQFSGFEARGLEFARLAGELSP
ncbi:MAG: UDP-N-acetylmuramoyl-L-alanine--D-glutamate ligase [Acetobacter sp.]|nr:UDP-N-acetylmuramoyl-L-alanine--D-glutamate ligase [Acetobacter sp.]